ncbi:MAG: hypothetical protein KatS3mg057_1579 [Herpetosiphonaceae bacterium]|nr:MAG: hypothetical protein KatS3mg057_1579 [Herpetosiphonaceae bacterium]
MILTREAVIAKIEERLAGRLSDAQLAAWAFDQSYAYEVEEIDYEEGAEELIDEVLDELMFADDPAFQLDEEELRELQKLLRIPPSGSDGAREEA